MTLWTLIQAAILPPAVLTEERPRGDGQKAWAEFQAHYRALEASQATQVVGRARRERAEIVHSALRRAVERVAS